VTATTDAIAVITDIHPYPNEVCALIAAREIPTIYEDRELGQRSVAWTLANTSDASKALMRELPFELRFPVIP
jgi:hypothetical protein